MIFPVKNLPVNWVDGMKISKDHFVDSDRHFHDLIRDNASIHLTNYNFGLLPSSTGKNTFEIQIHENAANTIEAKLRYCDAITPGGFRISVDAQQYDMPTFVASIKGSSDHSVNNNEVSWYEVILIADPYTRVPVGSPSLEENPPRHPYSDNRYTVQIVASDQLNIRELGAYYMVLGRIKNTGGNLSVLTSYIPPCTTITSHPALIQNYEAFAGSLQNLQGISLKIIRKIHEKNKPSSIAKNFMILCKDLTAYTSNVYYSFKNEMPHQSPIYLVGCFSSLANTLYTTLQCINPDEKEELLKYIFEWCDITPNDQEQALLGALEVRYNHYNIAESLLAIRQFLNMFEGIWTKLNTLEFIGQHKENIVVAKETVQPVVEPPKKKWSILD